MSLGFYFGLFCAPLIAQNLILPFGSRTIARGGPEDRIYAITYLRDTFDRIVLQVNKDHLINRSSEKVVIHIRLTMHGTIENLDIRHGSGNDDFDRKLIAAIKRAVPFARPLPTARDINFTKAAGH